MKVGHNGIEHLTDEALKCIAKMHVGKNNGLLDVSCASPTDKTVILAKGRLIY